MRLTGPWNPAVKGASFTRKIAGISHTCHSGGMAKTKKCCICEKRKPVTAFATRKRGEKSYLHSYCRPCWNAYLRDYRKDPKQKAKLRATAKRREKKLVEFVRSHKKAPCMDCKGVFKPWQMDFDHRPEEKKSFSLGMVEALGVGPTKILEEIAKCDLVCACCHRDRTHQRRVAQK